MSLDINKDFVRPNTPPFGMLDGIVRHAYEKESVLYFVFQNAWLNNSLYAICNTEYEHPTMVEEGLLELVDADNNGYRLTKKSIGLLYGVYGR